ncbi:MAG: hypothetical protein J6X44_13065 [Thermoguttaceae bacterium]|nr:hypothetical protein [Thermoguttaceae bacterium]
MSKFALLICVDDPSIDGGGSSYADALAFSRALKRFWSFNDSEIVVLSSRGRGELYATRSNVEKQFEAARGVEKLDSLIVGFWGPGVIAPEDAKRRFCLANFDASDVRGTTVSLGSLVSATLRLRAKDSCFICDCRPTGLDGGALNADDQDCKTLLNYARRTEPGYKFAALTACSAGERPIDLVEGRKGLFTVKLIEGIFDSAKRYQGSFDSVAGYAVQHTKRAAQESGSQQFPYFANAGDGDVRFALTRGARLDEEFDAYAQEALRPVAQPPKAKEEDVDETPDVESEVDEENVVRRRENVWLPLTFGVVFGAAAFAVLADGIFRLFHR